MPAFLREEKEEELMEDKFEKLVAPQAAPRKYEIVYHNLVTFGYGHIAALYGLYLVCTVAKWQTLIFSKSICFF